MTTEITAKITKVAQLGNGQTDVEVELTADGKPLGVHKIRVNREGKEAEQIAVDNAKAMAAVLSPATIAPAKATPKPVAKPKPVED
jgi:hypothetical protein